MSVPARLTALPARQLPAGFTVYESVTLRSRALGLAGVDALSPHRGLHLRPCRAVHTFGMRFALDLVWLDSHGEPLRVDRDVPPARHRACRRARSVIEVAAGSADALIASWCVAGSIGGILRHVDPDARPRLRLLKRTRHS
ncbi:unannotated protein [freshwater metagenome]|uniref:Unannotated protein n=1 Tax=freshwater metagenome TaxID=449393 RepID=A0A6J7EIP2_9ZZZZ|nr:DUF192 domain-containing protein [Actinomycetota bacterium]